MFKLENYITPILLSYVDKYIKNFRPEDSQLSLWGGDVSFQNLDLRLEVLEHELQLPFSFVSGHIHELLIHVPWTKLMSQPITITINTIECILKLRGKDTVVADPSLTKRPSPSRSQELETPPPGYLQSVINKIISNIQVICKNLILKYVEEDIVVSVNVKLLTYQSANEKWEESFTDISTNVRKLITVSDLTICLDKRNAAGKIDTYQEPVLYRCSLTMHMLRQYHAVNANRASVTRLDVYCSSMEFGMTEQQIPMLMRIIMLGIALHQKQLQPHRERNTDSTSTSSDQEVVEENQESWTSWAWSWVPSITPGYFDTDWFETASQPIYSGHTLHVGFYVDYASFTFKVSESSHERGTGYYTQKKIKYFPLLSLRLQGLFSDVIVHELKWLNCSFGISQAVLLPVGYCSCSVAETPDGLLPTEYLKAGLISMAHKTDSLFDAEAPENKGQRRSYNTSWEYHLDTTSEEALLERTPAFAYDVIYQLELPSDVTSEKLSEYAGDFEYSNFHERSFCRMVFGRLKLRICSGLFHRISSLRVAASMYDYTPYTEFKVDPPLSELLPPSAEDYDALSEYIPFRETRITILAPVIEVQLMDHPFYEASKGNLFRRYKKISLPTPPPSGLSMHTYPDFPKLTLECQCIDVKMKTPMYIKRLVHTVCQLPDAPHEMFNACHTDTSIKVLGICSRLIMLPKKYTTIIPPCSASMNIKQVLKPQYWIHPDLAHQSITFESECLSITGTRPKIMLATTIIDRLLKKDNENNSILNSSLIQDSHRHYGLNYIEFYLENIRCRSVSTSCTRTVDFSLGAIRGFVYQPLEAYSLLNKESVPLVGTCSSHSRPSTGTSVYSASREIQQMLFISGPEVKKQRNSNVEKLSAPLFTAALQFPVLPDNQHHPSLLLFSMQEIKICVDPLLYSWIVYHPKTNVRQSDSYNFLQQKCRSTSDASSSIVETRRIGMPHESVHSSSDRETSYPPILSKSSKSNETDDGQDYYFNILKRWQGVWQTMVVNGHLAQCIIYFPEDSLSAVGTQDIQEAVEAALKTTSPPEILTLVMPFTHIFSNGQQERKYSYVNLPIKLSTEYKTGFPWTISVNELNCYTLQKNRKLNVIKAFSLSITIGVTTKTNIPRSGGNAATATTSAEIDSKISNMSKYIENICKMIPSENFDNVEPLAICVHVDMTPITLTISRIQINLIAKIMFGLREVSKHVFLSVMRSDKQETYTTTGWSPAMSPTLLKEGSVDSVSEKTPSAAPLPEVAKSESKITAWIQWTITRCTIKVLSCRENCSDEDHSLKPNVKFVLDVEDIVSSVDFHSVYLKVKSKLASAEILHFELDEKNTWRAGPFSGVLMKVKEDVTVLERQEDTNFISVTVTRASCQHTHALWGTPYSFSQKQNKIQLNNEPRPANCITEVVVTTQAIDFTLPLAVMNKLLLVFEPLIAMYVVTEKRSTNANQSMAIGGQDLPLAYLECRGIRIVLPSSELQEIATDDDVFMVQVDGINLAPNAVNPICRTPCRPDIYQHAGQSRILNIPGSDLEDRQYQLDVVGLTVCSGTWDELNNVINFQAKNVSNLRTMRENPALEWNNLEDGKRINFPNFYLRPVVNKFDLSIVVAPAMLYKSSVLVCGHSIEINFLSDITINASLNQIKLTSALMAEFTEILNICQFSEAKKNDVQKIFAYRPFDSRALDTEEEIEMTNITRDSGIDTTDLNSSFSSKTKDIGIHVDRDQDKNILKVQTSDRSSGLFTKASSTAVLPNVIPMDLLITGGKILLCMYHTNKVESGKIKLIRDKRLKPRLKDSTSEQGYEGSEEGSADDSVHSYEQQIHPLLFISLLQPNLFVSKFQLERKTQLSCFDVRIKISGSEYVPQKDIPVEAHFPIDILETKCGMPNACTGISPAFFTLKWYASLSQPTTLDIEIGKPTKILCSLTRWNYLHNIKEKIVDSFSSHCKGDLMRAPVCEATETAMSYNAKASETYTKFREIKSKFSGVSTLNVLLSQLVLCVKTETSPEINFCIGRMKSQLNIANRPEKLTNFMKLDNLTIGMVDDHTKRLLLNPWSLSIETKLFWESWQRFDSNPQIKIGIESDAMMVDISPAHLKSLDSIVNDLTEFYHSVFPTAEDASQTLGSEETLRSDIDQHYKDDLRAGAFQFVDSMTHCDNELPLPYQVMFWYKKITAMAWRYPQPRTLTKVRVFPVPYKVALDMYSEEYQIFARLEYWSEHHARYKSYVQFKLSETEVRHLELPDACAIKPVSSVWRVVLTASNKADCDLDNMRVLISPRALAACMRIDSYFNQSLVADVTLSMEITSISISLYSNFNCKDLTMPASLKDYTCDFAFPHTQCFLIFTISEIRGYLARWHRNKAYAFDLTTVSKCTVLDYTFLTYQTLLESCHSKVEVNVADCVGVRIVSNGAELKFGPSAGHTLAVSMQMWHQCLAKRGEFTIITRYVVCNDTNHSLRFGQTLTDESILLLPRYCHLYCWRSQKYQQMLRVRLDAGGWTKPFKIDEEGTQVVSGQGADGIELFVTIRKLSATQKQVTVAGQLVICNMLLECFEFKVVAAVKEDRDREFKKSATYIINGRATPPSLVLDASRNYFLRLRFYGLESAWSGDIPLKENSNSAQPWLVKVPLQERGQFLSIWCRIIREKIDSTRRILAVLWPLFMIRSNLPGPAKIQVETPTLNVHLESISEGRGELQQLYCPGTIDHSHQISFKFDDDNSMSNSYVPLNYSLVDQKEFFKRYDSDRINDIIEEISGCGKSSWPYFDEELQGINWIYEEQPLTHVQVKYKNVCYYSSALLIEFYPWCLLVNTLGCKIALLVNGKEVCNVNQHGIVAPPKLEDTFNIGINVGGSWNLSLPLQLAESDWGTVFYMPKISGTIPPEGLVRTAVVCDDHVCMISINSYLVNEMRLLKVCSSHILTNHTSNQIQVIGIAVADNGDVLTFPTGFERFSFAVGPHLNESNTGLSLIQWYTLEDEIDPNNEIALYLSFSLNPELGWSCPIRVDRVFIRQSLSCETEDQSIPLVITAREFKGQTYLSLHHDSYPQMLIQNRTDHQLIFAQFRESEQNIVVNDSDHFTWTCAIDPGRSTYYTMPGYSSKFPDLSTPNFYLVIAANPEGKKVNNMWSEAINVNYSHEKFSKVPCVGDIKITVLNSVHTSFVTIESTSQVEINARDIRVRLYLQGSEAFNRPSQSSLLDTTPYTKTSLSDCSTVAATEASTPPKWSLRSNSTLDVNLSETILTSTLPMQKEWASFKIALFIKSVKFGFVSDIDQFRAETVEVCSLSCDNIVFSALQDEAMTLSLSVSHLQVDNQLYLRGGFDFPVVLVGQETAPANNSETFDFDMAISEFLCRQHNPIVKVDIMLETWKDLVQHRNVTGIKNIAIDIQPLSAFIEDVFVNKLTDYLSVFSPARLVIVKTELKEPSYCLNSSLVGVVDSIIWEAELIARPLTMQKLCIQPLSLLLSLHSSVKVYIALDQSPLEFSKFERVQIVTTSYKMGHTLTMHYLSGAIFGAGWMVGSLELLGSPGGLARAMGSGLRDFVALPYLGILEGPWAFLRGVTNGSASLMKHITAGTVHSITKLASSVARNLDRLTLDEEHLRRTEEQRRRRPQGLTQGFIQGITGLGISLLGAVGGIAHHPLQSVMSDGASPRGLAAGVGLGIVGVLTKPLSGAADLVALTGQGLLYGVGWNRLPEARVKPVTHHIFYTANSMLKYKWKYAQFLKTGNLLFVADGSWITNEKQYKSVALLLTTNSLVVISTDEDRAHCVFSLSELKMMHNAEPTLLTFALEPIIATSEKQLDEFAAEMDPASRARVADYVNSTAGLMQLPDDSATTSGMSVSPVPSPSPPQRVRESTVLTFYINSQSKCYLQALITLANHQLQNYSFQVL